MRPARPLLTFVSLALTACSLSSYQSEFQCNAPLGQPCRSLQQVYAHETTVPGLPAAPDPTRALPPQTAEEWTPPVKTVWIAPYVDTAGRRHEASILRLIVFPGVRAITAQPEFLIPPVPETTESGEFTAPPAPPPTPAREILRTIPSGRTPSAPARSQSSRGVQGGPPVDLPAGLPSGLFTPPLPQPGAPGAGFALPGS